MKDTTFKVVIGTVVGLVAIAIFWPLSLFLSFCATDTCTGIRVPVVTHIPTLLPATFPAPKVGAEAAAARPTCHIAAVTLIGEWVKAGASETEAFKFIDADKKNCTATFKDDVQKLFVTSNLWYSGAQACITCHYADVKKATMFMDLSSYAGILAGSQRKNGEPKGNDILGGGDWDKALLHKMLYAPNGKTELDPRPAMPFGRGAVNPPVPADGPIISAGTPTN